MLAGAIKVLLSFSCAENVLTDLGVEKTMERWRFQRMSPNFIAFLWHFEEFPVSEPLSVIIYSRRHADGKKNFCSSHCSSCWIFLCFFFTQNCASMISILHQIISKTRLIWQSKKHLGKKSERQSSIAQNNSHKFEQIHRSSPLLKRNHLQSSWWIGSRLELHCTINPVNRENPFDRMSLFCTVIESSYCSSWAARLLTNRSAI